MGGNCIGRSVDAALLRLPASSPGCLTSELQINLRLAFGHDGRGIAIPHEIPSRTLPDILHEMGTKRDQALAVRLS